MNVEDFVQCCRYGEMEELNFKVTREFILTKNEHGQTGLHMAAANGHLNVLEHLLKQLLPGDVNVQNNEGNTPLHWATLNGHLDAVRMLLAHGGDARLCNSSGMCAITLADEQDRTDILKELMNSFDPEDEELEREIEGEAEGIQEAQVEGQMEEIQLKNDDLDR